MKSRFMVALRRVSTALIGLGWSAWLLADTSSDSNAIGGVAKNITNSMESLGKLITAGSAVAGLGFAVGAVLKFKQHKDNPTQIPVGTPIALIFIAAALLFLPSVFNAVGHTLFGDSPSASSLKGDISAFDGSGGGS